MPQTFAREIKGPDCVEFPPSVPLAVLTLLSVSTWPRYAHGSRMRMPNYDYTE